MDTIARRTKASLILSSLLDEPLFTAYALFSIILKRDLGASVLQISLLTMLRPTLAVFSFYWGAWVSKHPEKLRQNLVMASLLQRLPFLFFPFVQNVWYFIFAALIYTLFQRAGTPALMEILKQNLAQRPREKLFSLSSSIGYLEGVFLGILIGIFLNSHPQSWRELFFACGMIGMGTVLIQNALPYKEGVALPKKELKRSLIQPWKDSLKLLKEHKDFRAFQTGFMLCGFGLMLTIPSIPFFVDNYNISYLELAISFSLCKGLGFVIASPVWAHLMERHHINRLTSALCACFGLFIACLILTPTHIGWLYAAYVAYGVSQGGSHLLWHMSGPIFAKDESSTPYSTVNVLLVGVRGIVGPLVGALLCAQFGPLCPFTVGMLLCLFASWRMLKLKPEFKQTYV